MANNPVVMPLKTYQEVVNSIGRILKYADNPEGNHAMDIREAFKATANALWLLAIYANGEGIGVPEEKD